MSEMNKNHNNKVAFVGFVVPEDSRWRKTGAGRAGNLASNGFVEALLTSGVGLDRVWSFQPVAVWPRGKELFSLGEKARLDCGATARLMPLVNLPIVRECVRLLSLAAAMFTWSICNRKSNRIVVVYNIFFPQAIFMRIVTWLAGIKLVTIIYELGTIQGYHVNLWHRLFNMGILHRLGVWCIPRFDGLLPISDPIVRDYAPGKPYLRVDGGLTRQVVANLPELTLGDGQTFKMMFAGGVNHWNHIDAMLKFMKVNNDPRLRLWIAGWGEQIQDVQRASEEDSRIVCLETLDHDALFRKYAEADVLLNLRDMSDPALAYHYPSKLLEILVMGKPVITTNTNHTREAYGHICKVIDGIDELGDAVRELMLMSVKERCEYGKRAREWMLANKTWKAQGPAIKEYIESKVVGR